MPILEHDEMYLVVFKKGNHPNGFFEFDNSDEIEQVEYLTIEELAKALCNCEQPPNDIDFERLVDPIKETFRKQAKWFQKRFIVLKRTES